MYYGCIMLMHWHEGNDMKLNYYWYNPVCQHAMRSIDSGAAYNIYIYALHTWDWDFCCNVDRIYIIESQATHILENVRNAMVYINRCDI